MKLISRSNDDDSGLISMFLNLASERVEIFRHDCNSGYDRKTGKYKRSFVKLISCGIPKPKATSRGRSSDGIETADGQMELITRDPIYSSDQRDNASADIVFVRSKFWKVESVSDNCGYSTALMNLMPEDECKGIRGMLKV